MGKFSLTLEELYDWLINVKYDPAHTTAFINSYPIARDYIERGLFDNVPGITRLKAVEGAFSFYHSLTGELGTSQKTAASSLLEFFNLLRNRKPSEYRRIRFLVLGNRVVIIERRAGNEKV